MGYKLNLYNPQTFSEKLQWLKLYDHNPLYTTLVDKNAVKEYVAGIIGEEYIIPTLGVWEHFDDINFDELPNRFVLKCTHDSGSVTVCADKHTFDKEKAKIKLEKALKRNYYYHGREWPYKNVKPQIMAEEYLQNNGDPLPDYKFFCFNGVPEIMYISRDADENPRTDFFNMEFVHLPIKMRDQNADTAPSKPAGFEKMKQLAETLSEGLKHVRIDFFEADGHIYFGEYTLYHCGGFCNVQPEKWNIYLGDRINLEQ